LIEHDLFGKPLHTFPDHAVVAKREASLDGESSSARSGVDVALHESRYRDVPNSRKSSTALMPTAGNESSSKWVQRP
jgi:hypothetical protein